MDGGSIHSLNIAHLQRQASIFLQTITKKSFTVALQRLSLTKKLKCSAKCPAADDVYILNKYREHVVYFLIIHFDYQKFILDYLILIKYQSLLIF